jgi:hypothetical protein
MEKDTGARTLPDAVDHLLFAASTLEEGIREIERLLGVRPLGGGRHPALGTHNALVALGAGTYLEIIAPDPSLPPPPRGRLFEPGALPRPALVTWVLRDEHIESTVSRARERGLRLGEVSSGHRQTPDGKTLSWQVSDPYAMPLDGAVPFVIAWGDTPHPSGVAPEAGNLIDLQIRHPEPTAVANALACLGVDAPVMAAERFELIATIRTRTGEVRVR